MGISFQVYHSDFVTFWWIWHTKV